MRRPWTDWPLLSLITFLPLGGVLHPDRGARRPKRPLRAMRANMALWTSALPSCCRLFLWFSSSRGTAEFQFVERVEWMPEFNIAYHMGVDGISMPFVLLSTLLTPICILASWDAIKTGSRST